MKIIKNFDDFYKYIHDDINPLTYEEFVQTEYLGKFWDKLPEDDIRKKALKSKENFYKWAYNLIHDKKPLKYFFDKRLSFKPVDKTELLEIKNSEVKSVSNNSRPLRNINLEYVLDTRKFNGETIKEAYKKALESGCFSSFFLVPSVFKDLIENEYESFSATIKTHIGLPSIFSPSLYRTLLTYKNIGGKLLCPTSSWCSPVIACNDMNSIKELHIVDVQCDVLKTCEKLNDYISGHKLFKSKLKTKTFCTPSEKMNEIIDNDYDNIFFCPPYFDFEVYGGSNLQSTTLYKTYEEWLDGYWRGTVDASYDVLKDGGLFCFVIGNYINSIYMAKDMLKVAKEKFEYVDEVKIYNSSIDKAKIRDKGDKKFEICYYLKKV